MREVPIIGYPKGFESTAWFGLLRLPYVDMESLELGVEELMSEPNRLIYGVIAPYSDENIEFNLRCASRVRDRFPKLTVYTAVPKFKARDNISNLISAGFIHICIPLYLGKQEYDHYFQFIQPDIIDSAVLHVAGGQFSSDQWNREEWTWSKDQL